LARPWSARCYGVARQREGSRQNSIGVSGVLSLRHFGLVLFIPWRVGAEQAGAAKDAIMAYGFGGGVADFVRNSWLRGPRLSYLSPLRGREGAAGQAVVCPLLRGSSPTRGVAPKRHRGLRRAFSPAFRAGSLYPLIPWRVGAEEAGAAKYGFGGAMLLDRLGAPGFRFIDFRAPRFPFPSPLRARALMARPWSARCYGVARQREGSRQNSIGGSGVLSLRHFGLVLFIP